MKLPSFCSLILLFLCVFPFLTLAKSTHGNSNLFRQYIGALFNNVTFSEVPINPGVEFHFILAFAIDYTGLVAPKPTNGDFNVFWDSDNLSPSQVCSIKSRHENVKVALSIGGDSVGGEFAYFDPVSEDTWVSNAVSSLTKIIQGYHLDGIDIDYEHFKAHPATFAKCIGRVIQTLKEDGVIKFASIAPYADDQVQKHYLALWKDYKKHIDYVNFQFYAYANTTTVSKFLGYFNEQTSKYKRGKVLVSYVTDGNGGLSPEKGFFTACSRLKSKNQLYGIFVWCADASKANGFIYEERSQKLLANSRSML